MKFAILAAGEGSRLTSEGISISKPLVEISGIPMIERIINSALKYSFSSIHCIINEHSPDLKEYLTTKDFGIPLHLIVKSTSSSMHSLIELSAQLKDSPFCLSTADTVFAPDEFRNYIHYCNDNLTKADGVLAVTNFIDDENPLYVNLLQNNDIKEFSDNYDGIKYVTGGLYFFSPSVFNIVNKALTSGVSRLRNFLKLMLDEGYTLKAFKFKKMIDVDHIKDIAEAENFLSKITLKGNIKA
ncbi:MAG: NDP-sugar synthase [Ignavibacteriae bacterium]|nr:MAG: NDP-sugar synthase [Ignavibacteriota bacterium]